MNLQLLSTEVLSFVNYGLRAVSNPESYDLLVVRLESVEHAINTYMEEFCIPWGDAVLNIINTIILLIMPQIESMPEPVLGRPPFFIPISNIECLLSLRFKAVDIAKLYSVSKDTIHRRMKAHNLSVSIALCNILLLKVYL